MNNSSASLEAQYSLRFAANKLYRDGVWQILCTDFFQTYIPTDATVLDLGAGWGEFINHIRCTQKYAMDLNPGTAQTLAPEVRFLQQDCAQRWQLADESLEVVFTSNFLEHLPDKQYIEAAIAEAWRCLKPGGLLICLGPNIKYVPGAYWDFWDHYVPLTENSLAELLKLKGYLIESCLARFLPYTMSGRGQPPLVLVKLYLKLPFVWKLFGKQFLVLGRKPLSPARPL
jgi:SAM-dependent methyltransferase